MSEIGEKERNYLFKSYTYLRVMNINIFIKIPKSLKTPTNTHSPSFPSFSQSGVPYLRKRNRSPWLGSSWFFPVIRAQLTGLPQFPAPSAVLLGSSVLNPKPRGTFILVYQQESFHPFPSCSISTAFFQTATRELCIAATSYFLVS